MTVVHSSIVYISLSTSTSFMTADKTQQKISSDGKKNGNPSPNLVTISTASGSSALSES